MAEKSTAGLTEYGGPNLKKCLSGILIWNSQRSRDEIEFTTFAQHGDYTVSLTYEGIQTGNLTPGENLGKATLGEGGHYMSGVAVTNDLSKRNRYFPIDGKIRLKPPLRD